MLEGQSLKRALILINHAEKIGKCNATITNVFYSDNSWSRNSLANWIWDQDLLV